MIRLNRLKSQLMRKQSWCLILGGWLALLMLAACGGTASPPGSGNQAASSGGVPLLTQTAKSANGNLTLNFPEGWKAEGLGENSLVLFDRMVAPDEAPAPDTLTATVSAINSLGEPSDTLISNSIFVETQDIRPFTANGRPGATAYTSASKQIFTVIKLGDGVYGLIVMSFASLDYDPDAQRVATLQAIAEAISGSIQYALAQASS
jgi:hypothetical protein